MTSKPWHAEYERMLLEEAVRRMKRQRPRDMRTWALASRMSRAERYLVAVVVALGRFAGWLRGKMRP